MTDEEIEKLVKDYQCYGIIDKDKLIAMTAEDLKRFREKNQNYLELQRCYRGM